MIELVHAEVRRGGRPVLAPAILPLPASGHVGIVGVNGAGKSTLFHALTGALPRSAGRAEVRGVAGAIGYSPQQPAFPEWLAVDALAPLYGQSFDQLTRRFPGLLLDELRGRGAGTLSVGQRQALSVGLALALDARLTVLDEPFAPLDFRRRIGLVRSLQERRASGGLALISSQAAVDLLDTCGWIVVLRDGRYVFSGPTAELTGGLAEGATARERFEEAVVALLDDASPISASRTLPECHPGDTRSRRTTA